MATTMSITEIKRDFYEVCDRVAAGERIIITKWGRPVAAMESAVPEVGAEVGATDIQKISMEETRD